jgi:hypothetical protein
MRTFLVGGWFALAAAMASPPCAAQVLEQPLRSTPRSEAERTTQRLTVSASALGGYDDQLGSQGPVVDSPDSIESGYTGYADASLRYWRGRDSRFFSLDGSTYLLSYSNLSIDSPIGGQARVAGATTFGRTFRIDASQYLSTDPYVSFGAFGALSQDLGVGTGPDANPQNSLTPNRSWGANSAVSADWRPTQRSTVSAGYSYARHEFLDDVGFNNRTHAADMTFDRALTRTFSARGSYRFSDMLVAGRTALSAGRPIVDHTAEAGFRYVKRLSATRQVELEAGAGATHLSTAGELGLSQFETWTPTGHALARADVGRTWAVLGSYRRGVTVLDGISPEPFIADAVLLQTEGDLNRRIEVMLSAGYSNGAQRFGLVTGRYNAFTMAAEARFIIAQPWAVVIGYNRTDYQLIGFLPPPLGPTPTFDRNAIRIGVTYSFTLSPRSERPARPGRTEN